MVAHMPISKYAIIFSFIILAAIILIAGVYNIKKNTTMISSIQPTSESVKNIKIRPPAVAGSFYPDDPNELSEMIDNYIHHANKAEFASETAKMIIAPHAGYVYSGQVTATAFKSVNQSNISRVVIVGRSHKAYFNEIAVDGNDAWNTPLGTIDLDIDFIKKLQSKSKLVSTNSEIHADEHSLEVMTPFIIKLFGLNTKIVPLLFGNENMRSEKELADVLGELIDEKTLIVVSTDLSHYPNPKDAKELDQATIAAIMTNDADTFHAELNRIMSENTGKAETLACGEAAVGMALYLSENLGLRPTLITSTNSGEVHPESSTNVVGYAAIAFYGDESPASQVDELSKEEQKTALQIARETIKSYFDKINYTPKTNEMKIFNEKRGAFVTLRKDEALRGCIGLFESDIKLGEVISDMALSAAFEDPRFTPLTKDELKEINIEISVLTPMKKISSIDNIELGKHGVYIKRGSRTGVYLPQVATETGWGKNTFLDSLCIEKAGLEPGCWKSPDTEIFVFTAQVFSE